MIPAIKLLREARNRKKLSAFPDWTEIKEIDKAINLIDEAMKNDQYGNSKAKTTY